MKSNRLPAGSLLALFLVPAVFYGQNDWRGFGNDPAQTRYSTLNQITPANVTTLKPAWMFDSGKIGRHWEATPLVIDGVMYCTLPPGADGVVALDPLTGKELWHYKAPSDHSARSNRSVSYWPGDSKTPPRLLFASGDTLIALSTKTGQPVKEFGDNGLVNLRAGVADKFPNGYYSFSSPPAIYKDLAILGPSTQETGRYGPSGDPRAFNIRTGKLAWRFHLIPQPGEPNTGTWGENGWQDRSGPSLWGLITIDKERGIVYLPVGNPAGSFYGKDRPGTNLYANCILALDAGTGKMIWFFQTTHHDLLDSDLSGAPILFDINRNGKKIPALAQVTKLGIVFILDRVTGKPVYGVEERAVPQSAVPGEQSWPTQPFPVKPPPLGRLSLTHDDITTVTAEARKYCLDWWDKEKMHNDGPYSTYGENGTSVVFPSTIGGGNWSGMSFSPSLGYLFVNVSNLATIGHMVKVTSGPEAGDYRVQNAYTRFADPYGHPCQQPPYGEVIAINANTGDIAWRSPLGDFDDWAAKGIHGTGTPGVGGTIVTAGGLVFVGATRDKKFRAFDAKTGKELWAADLDAPAAATPMTFRGKDGKQYVVIAAGGPSDAGRGAEGMYPQRLVAFTLP